MRVSYPGKKKEGKTFSIEYIGKRMNKFHLFHIRRMRNLAWSSRLLSLLRGRDLLEMSILVFNKFILFRYLVGKVGVGRFGRTWKTSIEQNQSQEARCQPNVMKTYPSGLGRLLRARDERRPRKRKSEVKRNVWWPPNILFLRFADGKSFVAFNRSAFNEK